MIGSGSTCLFTFAEDNFCVSPRRRFPRRCAVREYFCDRKVEAFECLVGRIARWAVVARRDLVFGDASEVRYRQA
jgi:hypothetical protein